MNFFSMTILMMILTSCSAMLPELFKTVDDIATDEAIKVQVDKEALMKDTDVRITVDVINKDIKSQAVIPPPPVVAPQPTTK